MNQRPSLVCTILGDAFGVSSACRAVSRHNGTLTFQTQERIGTVFTIRLPIHPSAAVQPAEEAA